MRYKTARRTHARDRLMRLFEMVRAAHAALTSCAWFFDDFGGLEGRIALRWAARAVELAAELAAHHRARAAAAAARDPIESPRNRRRRDPLFEPQDARSAREGLTHGCRRKQHDIESILREGRKFPPSRGIRRQARSVKGLAEYEALYRRAEQDPEDFWGECARELAWFKPFGKVLDWQYPFAKWFVGGEINASYNCLDRHLTGARRNKVALIWEGEPGDSRVLTYQMLAMKSRGAPMRSSSSGVKKGDRVAIYMPLVPEAAIAMLACARIGAIHSVIFGGFSAEALVDRINDAEAKLVITADGGWRRGQQVELKANVDEALKRAPSVRKCLVVRRTGEKVEMRHGRDVWWDEIVPRQSPNCPAEPLDSEHPLFTLYTSGTTGKPKGVVHTTGGYLTHTLMTMKWVFDLKDEDIFWCTADIGWVTGHSYTVYGPLAAGATVVMYEGAPNFPQERPLLGDYREIPRQYPLHRADRDSHLYQMGRLVGEEA